MTRDEERKLIAEHFRKLLPKEFEMIDVDYEMRYSRFIAYWRRCDYKNKSNGRSYFAAGHIYLRSKDVINNFENFVKVVLMTVNKPLEDNDKFITDKIDLYDAFYVYMDILKIHKRALVHGSGFESLNVGYRI